MNNNNVLYECKHATASDITKCLGRAVTPMGARNQR